MANQGFVRHCSHARILPTEALELACLVTCIFCSIMCRPHLIVALFSEPKFDCASQADNDFIVESLKSVTVKVA